MPNPALGLTLSLLLIGAANGQTDSRVRFEVAAIKSGGDVFSTRPQRSPGRISWTTQIVHLVAYAYHMDTSQVLGSHLGAIYTVQATFAPTATDDQVRLMVQSLLAERFKIQLHPVTTEKEGYVLSVGRGGAKLTEAKTEDASYVTATLPKAGVVAITGHRASIPELAVTLQRSEQMPVWDKTGLTGSYDFAFRYAQDFDAQVDFPSLTTALQSLGLSVKKEKGPFETLVIDNIDEPSLN